MSTHDKQHAEHHDAHDGKRVEDFRLITGTGKYAADWNVPGQLYGHFVRSDHAHAEILSVNTQRALAAPGVKGVFTGADAVAAGYVRVAHVLGSPGKNGMKGAWQSAVCRRSGGAGGGRNCRCGSGCRRAGGG
jgi:CO/xanthine dehydrogenase Mo-binding subunit